MSNEHNFKFTPRIAVIIFVGIITVSILFSFVFKSYEDFQSNRLRVFMTSLSALGTIAVLFFYYGVIQLNQAQQRQAIVDQTLTFGTSINTDINRYIVDYVDDIPSFINSINPLSKCKDLEIMNKDENNYSNCIKKQILSKNIFNIWNNTVLNMAFLDYDPDSYITIFLQWANSHELFTYWKKFRYNYVKETTEFGDLLFEYGRGIKNLTPEEFKSSSDELINDPLFSDIVNRAPLIQ